MMSAVETGFGAELGFFEFEAYLVIIDLCPGGLDIAVSRGELDERRGDDGKHEELHDGTRRKARG